METKHLSYFKVDNFKRFKSLEVKDIGQFNLIVGDNNIGKSSLLDALLFDENNYNKFQYCLWNSLEWKNIKIKDSKINNLVFFLNNKNFPIKYSFSYAYNNRENQLSVRTRLKSELNRDELEKLAGLLIIYRDSQHLLEFTLNSKSELIFVSDDGVGIGDDYIPLITFNMIYRDDLVDFFSEISIETNNLKRLEIDLKSFIPNLESIEVNNALTPQQPVIAIRETGKDLISLSQYGDGTIKIFRYLLELEKCQNNRLLIDEVDTGIHYSRIKEFFIKVLRGAKDKNVQIFATTHSKECIEYYTKALKELGYENEGRIIRIADTKSGIKAYTMRFPEFESSLSVDSEIR
jgi:AAA15 family ATPase/GTPase